MKTPATTTNGLYGAMPGRMDPVKTSNHVMAKFNPIDIARICHEANRAYCRSIGDNSQKTWEKAPKWQQRSSCMGVRAILADTKVTPEELHEEWRSQKVSDGWVYGPKKNAAKKRHPCLMEYRGLPKEQRIKDELFLAIVKALSPCVSKIEKGGSDE